VFRSDLVDILNEAGYQAYGASGGSHAISIELIHSIACQQKDGHQSNSIKLTLLSGGHGHPNLFRSHVGVRKEATAMPAIAAKWLLTTGSLLGELADSSPAHCLTVILGADDDPTVRQFVKIILNREGYRVLEATDAIARKMAGLLTL
jgi:hypothetical protein